MDWTTLIGSWTILRASLVAILILLVLNSYSKRVRRESPKVPWAGHVPIPLIGSWIAAARFLRQPVHVLTEAVARSKNGLVRISTHQGDYILVTERTKVAEYLRAPDGVLSMEDGACDQQQIEYTMGYGVGRRTYHTPVVKGDITKRLGSKTPILVDEIKLSLNGMIGQHPDFQPIALYDVIAMTIARASSRLYVGKEFCQNSSYLQNAIDYAQAVVLSAELLRIFPEALKPIIVKILPVMSYRRKGEEILGQFIQDRLDGKADVDGERPEDLVQWLIDAAPPVEKTVSQLAERVMALNVASIHTTTMTFTAALYSLAAEPEKYIEPLRQEVLDNLVDGEVTFQTVSNLPKMESFLRESGRCNNTGLMAMQRNARKDFRFSDGTVIPAGSKVGSPTWILHKDPEIYPNPDVFDGFRFCKRPSGDPAEAQKKIVTPGPNFHVFGAGRHPCPGRFLAAHEMKIMFSELLLRYDIRLAPGTKPQPFFLATMMIPDTQLKVLFRTRK